MTLTQTCMSSSLLEAHGYPIYRSYEWWCVCERITVYVSDIHSGFAMYVYSCSSPTANLFTVGVGDGCPCQQD